MFSFSPPLLYSCGSFKLCVHVYITPQLLGGFYTDVVKSVFRDTETVYNLDGARIKKSYPRRPTILEDGSLVVFGIVFEFLLYFSHI